MPEGFEALSKLATNFQSFIDWLNRVDWESVATAFNEGVRQHVEAARLLAVKGWTIPPWIGMSECLELCELTEVELDQRFGTAFSESNYRLLQERIDEILSVPEMETWSTLLLEVQDSIVNGRNLIVVPAMLTILEGYVVRGLVRPDSKNIRRTNLYKLVNEAGLHTAYGLTAMPAVSCLAFLQSLFMDANFSEAPPPNLNRHWIIHGRGQCNWTQADAFRLVNALDTLLWLNDTRTRLIAPEEPSGVSA